MGRPDCETDSPKISVLIPTYKYGRYIGTAIESVLSQDYEDFELVICDDASRDSTAEIVSAYARSDKRIRFVENSDNLGMTRNWNSILREARGEYVKFVFGDDMLTSSDCLSSMVKALDSNPSVSLVTSTRKVVDEQGKKFKDWSFPGPEGKYEGHRIIWGCLLFGSNLIGEPTAVMFRRENALRGFDNSYRQLVDLEMWFHLLEMGDLYFIRRPLCGFRIHDEQQSAKNKSSNIHDTEILRLHGSYKQNLYASGVAMSTMVAALYLHFLPAHFLYNFLRGKVTFEVANAAMNSTSWIFKGALLLLPYVMGRTCRRWYRSFKKHLGLSSPKDDYFFKPLTTELS